MTDPFSNDSVKIVVGSLVTIILGILAWLGNRQTKRIDVHDDRITNIETQMVNGVKHEKDLENVYKKISDLNNKVDISVNEFRDEHSETRLIIKQSQDEILQAVKTIKNA